MAMGAACSQEKDPRKILQVFVRTSGHPDYEIAFGPLIVRILSQGCHHRILAFLTLPTNWIFWQITSKISAIVAASKQEIADGSFDHRYRDCFRHLQ
jgi:hypothetical protein